VCAPLGVDERARRESRQPPPTGAGELAYQAQCREQLILVDARALELDARENAGQQLAAGRARRGVFRRRGDGAGVSGGQAG
jgi:hypothetical protein